MGVKIFLAVLVCAAALYGVYHFRTSRLMPGRVEQIAEARQRLAQAEAATEQAAAETQTTTPTEAAPAPPDVQPSANDTPDGAPAANGNSEPANSADERPDVPMPDETPRVFDIAFETTKGEIIIRVFGKWAPHGADRIFELFKEHGFYTDMKFFRVLNGPDPYVVQWGIPAQPSMSAKWVGSNIPDDPVKQSNQKGYVTFAAGRTPNSRSTQIFVNLANNVHLDQMGFAPFGKVIEGMDVFFALNGEYGETITQKQADIIRHGNIFLDRRFPGLDAITGVRYLGEPPADDGENASTESAPADN